MTWLPKLLQITIKKINLWMNKKRKYNKKFMFVNNLILNSYRKDKEYRGTCPPNKVFDFIPTDHNVSVETERPLYRKSEKHEYVKELEQKSCEICKSKFKSSTNKRRIKNLTTDFT